jgi:UDP-N-acetyl-D-glucosamine dehydrogenase
MPRYVVSKLEEALDRHFSVPFSKARILILGLAYKKNVADIRESPSLRLIELLEKRGTKVDFHDPHVPEIPVTREHAELAGRKSAVLDGAMLSSYHAVVIVTDHDAVDYSLVAAHALLVMDTRNVFMRKRVCGGNIVKC